MRLQKINVFLTRIMPGIVKHCGLDTILFEVSMGKNVKYRLIWCQNTVTNINVQRIRALDIECNSLFSEH